MYEHEFPPDGAYCVADPHRPGTTSYWILRGRGLEAWPTGSAGKYGPPRPPRSQPGTTLEQRRDEVKYWRARLEEYRLEVLRRIAADPAGAAARWTRETERCSACRALHRAGELPDSAAAGRGRVDEELTDEQRDAMAVNLRRAGYSEALIAQGLGMSPTRVNRVARRAGIGAPLRPRGTGQTAMAATVEAGAV